jgi:hypothetical protein
MSISTAAFVIFRKFHNLQEAKEMEILLRDHDFACELQDLSSRFDASFAYNPTDKQFGVLLRQEDFDGVNTLLETISEQEILHLPVDYYLYNFSTQELLEVVIKSDEWNPLDIALAKKLLAHQGIDLDAAAVEQLKQKRLQELSLPDQDPVPAIVLGYVLALFGGLLGTAIGLALWFTKKRLPNGQKILAYSEKTRRHGLIISLIGLCWIPVSLATGIFVIEL